MIPPFPILKPQMDADEHRFRTAHDGAFHGGGERERAAALTIHFHSLTLAATANPPLQENQS